MLKLIKNLFVPRGNKKTAGELAAEFGLKISGDPKTTIDSVAPIADANTGQLTFYSTEKNSVAFKILPISMLKNTKASIILLQPEHIKDAPNGATLLISESPRGDIVKIMGEIYKEKPRFGIHIAAHIDHGVFFRKKRSNYIGPFATVEKFASLEPDVKIYPNAFIGRNVKLGRGTVVHSGAHIENATIGEDCVIYPNAVIGKDGFGFTRQDGKNVFIPHVGRVVIGNRVSVGSNSCIDRGAMTDTIIGDGTKIDNLCQIAHGVVIGSECFLASGVGIAGGAIIGNNVLIGGHTGIANKVKIGNNAEIGAHSGVFRDIPDGEKHLGYPAVPGTQFMRMHSWLNKQIKPS